MSIEAENVDHELTIQELLQMIVKRLDLLNDRFEDAFNTGIELEDLEDN